MRIYYLLLTAVLLSTNVIAQINNTEKKQVIDSVSKRLNKTYIYPEVATRMSALIVANNKKGLYQTISEPAAFAARLTADLVSISGDRHLNITFDPGWVQASKKVLSKTDSLDLIHKDFPNARRDNFGFKEVRVLDGNIGYLNLTKFYDPALGEQTAIAAMNFLFNTDALIIDLRHNGGGYGDMVQLVASYLFDTEPVLMQEVYSREGDQHKQNWTLPYIPGKRMPDKPVYLLTGPETFSAAESFAYFLKNRKRAVIIGQTTGAGAHPIRHRMLNDRFTIFVPYGRPIDPITKTDWEKTGVSPDVVIPLKEALLTAQIMALEKTVKTDPANKSAGWALTGLKAEQHPVQLPAAVMQAYAGKYSGGVRNILLENGQLYFQRSGQPKFLLTPLTNDIFAVQDLPYLRIQLLTENGEVTGFIRNYDDGSAYTEKRDE